MGRFLPILAGLVICSAQVFPQKIVEKGYYLTNPELGGDVVIKEAVKEIFGEKAIVTFAVEAPTAGNYYASFWIFPAKLADGSFAQYAVAVNGETLDDRIAPTVGDWQSATLANNSRLRLNKGSNTVSVIGSIPNIPNVEHVRLSSVLSKAIINDSDYRSYKTFVESNSIAEAETNALMAKTMITDTVPASASLIRQAATSTTEDPLYDYEFLMNLKTRYTFYTTVYFTDGGKSAYFYRWDKQF